MSIKLVVTRGFGNGTFAGNIGDVVTAGYGHGAIPPIIGSGFKKSMQLPIKGVIRRNIRNG